jgi:hypothetical protein
VIAISSLKPSKSMTIYVYTAVGFGELHRNYWQRFLRPRSGVGFYAETR